MRRELRPLWKGQDQRANDPDDHTKDFKKIGDLMESEELKKAKEDTSSAGE